MSNRKVFVSVVLLSVVAVVSVLALPGCACDSAKTPLQKMGKKVLETIAPTRAAIIYNTLSASDDSIQTSEVETAIAAPVVTPPAQNIRVTYVTESKGFKHGVLPESEKIMQELGKQNGFDVTISQESAKVITAENLKNVDVLIFYTTGELPWSDEQKKLFLDFIRNGKGFIGIHSATDTFYKWPEYGELIGGYFDGHPWTSNMNVTVQKVDNKFSVTKHWDDSWEWKEETYQYKQFNAKDCKVVLRMDIAKTDMTKRGVKGIHAVEGNANIKEDSFPLVWYRTYGKGRVFYSEPGHNSEVWNHPKYQTMLANAIKWAAKKMK